MEVCTHQHCLDPLNERVGERSQDAEEHDVHHVDYEEHCRLNGAVGDQTCE